MIRKNYHLSAPGPFSSQETCLDRQSMAALTDKVQNALDESRILILGAQVFIGFQFRSVLETGFATLPVASQYL